MATAHRGTGLGGELVDRLAAVLDTVRQQGLGVGRIHLRESTLEDVFLAAVATPEGPAATAAGGAK